MAEYIEREALLKRLEVTPLLARGIPEYVRAGVLDLARKQPAADVAPVWHGRLEYAPFNGVYDCYCSVCGFAPGIKFYSSDYCPNCGARMDGGADNGK